MTATRSTSPNAQSAAGVKSAERALDLMEYLAAHRSGATFPQISQDLGFPKSSLHALLGTLVGRGWIYLDEERRLYRIGVRVWETAQSFAYLDSLAHRAEPHLRAARDQLNETVQLAVLDGIDNVYIAKVEADHPLRLVSRVGMRLPAYATGLGKVLLAFLDPADLKARLEGVAMRRFTQHTIATSQQLFERVKEIRERGFGEDDGEYTPGVFCVAVPVRDATGRVVAAMSCSIPRVRLGDGPAHRDHLVQTLTRHCDAMSRDLGWRAGGV
ncbi:IclR family transcriptional regulator [Dactylosporangium sp. AC04546]|uniref:IclR family transcriptional regulator n=1 Tax=Dactylosporangium sp. AC04546 TaxID=2862460 RepID=UPI001EE10281|nr:IclR family transcriptional regulator [Dactylosporangium sp. AC04546]WVK79590.1 IclR family transcriptional regulator [Dactylosporangium sp. AC04546]